MGRLSCVGLLCWLAAITTIAFAEPGENTDTLSATQTTDVSIINSKNKQRTKTSTNGITNTKNTRAKKQVVRKMRIKEKKQNAIRARDLQIPPASAYSVSARTVNLKSPMCQYAAKNDVVALKRALLASNYSVSEVNTICKYSESLFFIAVKNNNYLASKLLIEKGADVNFQNEAGVSALHIAARVDTPNMDRIFELLLHSRSLNINIKDAEGYTPLMRAVEFEKISVVRALVRLGADKNVKNNYGHTAVDLAKNISEGAKNNEEKAVSEAIVNILMAEA